MLTLDQSGFIPGDSTVNQLLTIYNDLCTAYNEGVTTQAVFLDISKAFDRVWHGGLLSKLKSVGITGTLLHWFQYYLSNRTQCVVVKGEQSDKSIIDAGVPQGSVLGPLLFLIYINDIVKNITSVIKLFADDTSMSLALKDPVLRRDILNSDLEKINNWAKQWKVKFNENKTELLNLTRDKNLLPVLVFGQTDLQDVTSHKHLGIILQNNCKWNEHINNIASKANLLITCLKQYKYRLNRKTLEIMYKSFILPIFDYADIIWDNCSKQLADSLEVLHLEAIRTIIGSVRGTSHNKLYKESGFCSLQERRKRHKLIFFHKLIHGNPPNYLKTVLPPLISSQNPYHRRRPFDRIVPQSRIDLHATSFLPSTTKLWNELPEASQSSPSISQFKRFLSKSDPLVPVYYYYGKRQDQITHCMLRLQMSNLNSDLKKRHLTNDSSCSCGYPNETTEHYLLHCPFYLNL